MPLFYRADARLALGDATGALADLDRAVALAPNIPTPLAQRARLKLKVGDRLGAVADAQEARRLAPREAELGVLLNEAKDQARNHYVPFGYAYGMFSKIDSDPAASCRGKKGDTGAYRALLKEQQGDVSRADAAFLAVGAKTLTACLETAARLAKTQRETAVQKQAGLKADCARQARGGICSELDAELRVALGLLEHGQATIDAERPHVQARAREDLAAAKAAYAAGR